MRTCELLWRSGGAQGSYSILLSSHEPITQVSEHKTFHTNFMIPCFHYGVLFFSFILNVSVQ